MFVIAGTAERRRKIYNDRLFCAACCAFLAAGPLLTWLGLTALAAPDARTPRLASHNAAAAQWKSRWLEQFNSASFSVGVLDPAGANSSLVSRCEKTADLAGELLNDADEALKQYQSLVYRTTSPLLRRLFYGAGAETTYTLVVAAEFQKPQSRRSTFSLPVPLFSAETRELPRAECEWLRGEWLGDPSRTFSASCVIKLRLKAACARVMLNNDYVWRLEDRGGVGCWRRNGQWVPTLYQWFDPKYEADFSTVALTLRSVHDPLLRTEEDTAGTLHLGQDVDDQYFAGVLLLVLAGIFFLPCLFVVYVGVSVRSRHVRSRVLAPESVAVDDDAAAAQARKSGAARKGGGAASGAAASGAGQPRVRETNDEGDDGFVFPEAGGAAGNFPHEKDGTASVGGSTLPAKTMLNFAHDLGIADRDVTDFMWLVEEALSPGVLGEWEAHVDSKGAVYFFLPSTSASSWEHPREEYYHNLYLANKSDAKVRWSREDDEEGAAGGEAYEVDAGLNSITEEP